MAHHKDTDIQVIMEPTYKIEIFEGPLDLLLSLIYKNKVDIMDIPITLIFEQYMEYLDQMREMDMDIAGEFIVMASELMLIKSRMLLPRPEGEEQTEDPRTKLANALIEYKHAKEVAEELDELVHTYGGRLAKDTEEIPADDSFIAEHSVFLLQRAMTRMLINRGKEELLKQEAERIQPIIKRRVVPVGEKVITVLRRVVRKKRCSFESLFDGCASRSELIATFLAVLELLKVNRISVSEPDEQEEIYISLNENYVKQQEETGENPENFSDGN
ncbi:MAG: segregation/condensation protein A [Clostridia bacterium]|nr:segregation/condensation protein A [Clostridia bacterium]